MLDITRLSTNPCLGMSLLLSLLAAKGLGALIGSIILLAQPGPRFSDPQLVTIRDSLYVQTALTGGFNKHLDQMLESGTTIAVGYSATLVSRDSSGSESRMKTIEFFHSAVYVPADDVFRTYQSEASGHGDSTASVATLDAAKRVLTEVRVPLTLSKELEPQLSYACRLQAALNTISLDAIEGKELDLNTFWNYRYPRGETPWTRPALQ